MSRRLNDETLRIFVDLAAELAADPRTPLSRLVPFYALLIVLGPKRVPWQKVNIPIIKRWDVEGLEVIRQKARRLCE